MYISSFYLHYVILLSYSTYNYEYCLLFDAIAAAAATNKQRNKKEEK